MGRRGVSLARDPADLEAHADDGVRLRLLISDTAPYEPQPGGSCTYLPFFNDDLIELPMTLPMDHTLFEILGHTDGSVWQEKAEVLRRRGGMILVLVHPNYARCPELSPAEWCTT